MQCIPEGDYLFFRNQPAAAYCHATTYTRTSQIDKRSNESVIMDVAQNNENLLVGTAFNSDAIHLGTSTRNTTRAHVHLEMESRQDEWNPSQKDVLDRMKAAARSTPTKSILCQPDLR